MIKQNLTIPHTGDHINPLFDENSNLHDHIDDSSPSSDCLIQSNGENSHEHTQFKTLMSPPSSEHFNPPDNDMENTPIMLIMVPQPCMFPSIE